MSDKIRFHNTQRVFARALQSTFDLITEAVELDEDGMRISATVKTSRQDFGATRITPSKLTGDEIADAIAELAIDALSDALASTLHLLAERDQQIDKLRGTVR